jgi:hypothetical protein
MKSLSDDQREQLLDRELIEAERLGGRPTFPVEIRGKTKHLSVFRVEISVPVFRLENGRTIRGLQEYKHENPMSAKALEDKSSAESQEIIQSVLLKMVAEENLINILADEGQRDPLILTRQGYVLNGNRRLAAMRKLSKDSKHAKDFQNVDVIVLPQLDEVELSSIEMRLQMAIEGKAKYNWVDELLVIQKNIKELKMTMEQVRVAMRTTIPSIKKKLLMYELVSEYLAYMSKQGLFFSVTGDEQAFKTLTQGMVRFQKRLDLQSELKLQAFEIIKRKPKHKSIHLQIIDVTNSVADSQSLSVTGPTNKVNSTGPLGGIAASTPQKPVTPMSDDAFSRLQQDLANHAKGAALKKETNKQLENAEIALTMVKQINVELARNNREKVVEILKKVEEAARKARNQISGEE